MEGFANAGEGPGTELNAPPSLGDRVVNIRCPFVPLGLRGIVVAIHPTTGCVEVVFDAEFIGGKDLNGLCSRGRGRLLKWSELLSLTKPEKVKPPVAIKAVHAEQGMPKKKQDGTENVKTQKVEKKSKKKKKNQSKQEANTEKLSGQENLANLLEKAGISVPAKNASSGDSAHFQSLLAKAGISTAKNNATSPPPPTTRPMFHSPAMMNAPTAQSMNIKPPAMMPPLPMMHMMPQQPIPRGVGAMPMGKGITGIKTSKDTSTPVVKRVPRTKKVGVTSSLTPGHIVKKAD